MTRTRSVLVASALCGITICAGACTSASAKGGDATPADAGADGLPELTGSSVPEAGTYDAGADGSPELTGSSVPEAGTYTSDGSDPVVVTVITAKTGSLSGTVVDAATDQIITGAKVTIGGTSVPSATGAFSTVAQRGRVFVAVEAPGYLHWSQTAALTDSSQVLTVKLLPAPAVTLVPASGAMIAANGATFAYAPGAYPNDTPVVAAWLGLKQVASMSGPMQFEDEDGLARRIVGVLHVEAASEPAVPVTVTVPIPDGAGAVRAYHLDPATGTWGEPLEPISVVSGTATFAVSRFDDEGIFSTRVDDFLVQKGSCSVTDSNGSAFVANEGDAIPAGSMVLCDKDGLILDPTGHETSFDPDLHAVVTIESDPPNGTAALRCTGVCGLTVKSSSPSRPFGPQPKPRFAIRTKTAVMGVRGTIAHFRDHLCPSTESREISAVQVDEGEVDLDGAPVKAGEEAKSCPECADPKNPACCDSKTCPDGCCTEDETCAQGNEDSACGHGGERCGACSTPPGNSRYHCSNVTEGGDTKYSVRSAPLSCVECGNGGTPCCSTGNELASCFGDAVCAPYYPNNGGLLHGDHVGETPTAGFCCIPAGSPSGKPHPSACSFEPGTNGFRRDWVLDETCCSGSARASQLTGVADSNCIDICNRSVDCSIPQEFAWFCQKPPM